MIRTLTFALALALAAAAPLASAKEIEVRFKDLDFSRASDVAEFDARLDRAAAALCAKTWADDHRSMRTEGEIRQNCREQVDRQVMAQMPELQRQAYAAARPATPVEMAGR